MDFIMCSPSLLSFFFFFNDTATTEIYTLSLHDALPIFDRLHTDGAHLDPDPVGPDAVEDRKSTRLNSSHVKISYAVFCLNKKKTRFGETVSFIGVDNFRRLLSSGIFQQTLQNSMVFTAAALTAKTVFGMALDLLLSPVT